MRTLSRLSSGLGTRQNEAERWLLACGRSWDRDGITMGSRWDRDGIETGYRWDRDGIEVGYRWDRDGISMGYRWDRDGTANRSRPDREVREDHQGSAGGGIVFGVQHHLSSTIFASAAEQTPRRSHYNPSQSLGLSSPSRGHPVAIPWPTRGQPTTIASYGSE
jgi:hypothetical protein